MKNWLLGLCLLLVSPVLVIAGEKENLAKEMLSLLNLQQSVRQLASQHFQLQSEQILARLNDKTDREALTGFIKKVHDLLMEEIAGQEAMDDYIRLVADTYSETELRDILQFYKSPSGQSMLKKQPVIAQKSVALSQTKMALFDPKMKRLLEDFYKEYEQTTERCASSANKGKVRIPFASVDEQKEYTAYSARIGCSDGDNKKLSEAYRNRGVFLSNHAYLQEALADFADAARVRPDYAVAYADSAIVYEKLGEYEKAHIYFTKSLKLDPTNSHVYAVRGNTYFYSDKYIEAQADFEKALSLNKGDMHRMLWLYLSIERQGRSAKKELRKHASDLDLTKWPGPIVAFYLENLSERQLLDSMKGNADMSVKEQQCEAYFFLAQKYLLKKEPAKAAEYFQKAVDTNIKAYMEYSYSLEELKRLKK